MTDARPADRVAERRDFGIAEHVWPTIVFDGTVRCQRVGIYVDRARYVRDDGLILDIFGPCCSTPSLGGRNHSATFHG